MKKLWILLLSIMLTIAFVACNNNRGETESSATSSSAQESNQTESESSSVTSSAEKSESSAANSSAEKSEESNDISVEVNSGWADVGYPPPKV